jgi:DNA-binding IclR family transcriptional regulator
MQDEGFAAQDADKHWQATMRLWQLGCAVNESIGMTDLAGGVLRDLVQRVDETVVYAAYEKGWLTYAGFAAPDKPVRADVPLGGRYGVAETRTGHAVLAFLPRPDVERILGLRGPDRDGLRSRQALFERLLVDARLGFSAGAGHRWPGVWGAAAPVFNHRGQPVGAIGVSVPAAQAREHEGLAAVERGPDLVREVVAAAQRLTTALGGPDRLPPSPLLGPAGSGASARVAVRRAVLR